MHKLNQRQDRYDKKKYDKKQERRRENLSIGEKVYVLAERIKKKSAPGKFYKQSVQNISYFNKDTVFSIRKKPNYWKHKILLDKKPICRADQTFLQIRTFCFKMKLFIMVAMLLLRRS